MVRRTEDMVGASMPGPAERKSRASLPIGNGPAWKTGLRRCEKCVLPVSFPGIEFDAEGICNRCRESAGKRPDEAAKRRLRERFEKLAGGVRGRRAYDCLAAYSGGKDSSYTLYLLRVRFGLNVLAVTFDNGFLAPHAAVNAERVVRALRIDHIIYRPRFDILRKVFLAAAGDDFFSKKTLERASSVCTACMSFAKFGFMRIAIERHIPLVVYGWSPGQAPLTASLFRHNGRLLRQMQEAVKGPLEAATGEDLAHYFLEEEHLNANEWPYNVSPLAFMDYDEEQVLGVIRSLGWERPAGVDANSTNCLLNSFANKIHVERLGFHPYALELANLVRDGILSRDEAISRLEAPEDPETVALVRKRLEID
jgi:tRNA(Ile)-lysidine synthase TilS/MesJ